MQNGYRKKKITIKSDGAALRDFIPLNLLKKVVIKLIDEDYDMPIINVCSGVTLSIRELAFRVKKNVFFKNKNIEVFLEKKKFQKIKKFKYDVSLLRSLSIKSNKSFDYETNKFLLNLKNQLKL